jgi:hypothetical protein
MDWYGDTINYGDVPTWLATLGAFIAAVFAYKALSLERDRDYSREKDEKRQQAEAVSAWIGMPTSGSDVWTLFHPTELPEGQLPPPLGVVIGNASRQPVYDVQAFVHFSDGIDSRAGKWLLLGGLSVLPPNGQTYIEPELEDDNAGPFTYLDWRFADVSVRFRDARGKTWIRDEAGFLERDKSKTPWQGGSRDDEEGDSTMAAPRDASP